METRKKRERHSAAFKAKVAVEAIKEKETLQDLLRHEGIHANHKRIRRLKRLMGLEALYPKNRLKAEGIQISMDGKGRAKDNIWIERFWNTIKREHIYFNPADDGLELYRGIKSYIYYYNFKRAHQGIGRVRPCELYIQDKTNSKASA